MLKKNFDNRCSTYYCKSLSIACSKLSTIQSGFTVGWLSSCGLTIITFVRKDAGVACMGLLILPRPDEHSGKATPLGSTHIINNIISNHQCLQK